MTHWMWEKIIIKTIDSPMMTIIDRYRDKEYCFSCPFILLPLIHYTQNIFYTQNEYKSYFIYTYSLLNYIKERFVKSGTVGIYDIYEKEQVVEYEPEE